MLTRLNARNASMNSVLDAALRDLAVARDNEAWVSAALGRESGRSAASPTLDVAYTRTQLAIRDHAMPLLVTVQSSTVGHRQMDAKGISLTELSEPVSIAGSALRKIRIRLRGRYESLPDLLEYFDRLRDSPAVVKSIGIVKDQFDAELLIIGV